MIMGNDEKIFRAFRKIEQLGKKQFTADAIAVTSGLRVSVINRKLDNLSKFGKIKHAGKKEVNYWQFV
jgi:hypothetical protein